MLTLCVLASTQRSISPENQVTVSCRRPPGDMSWNRAATRPETVRPGVDLRVESVLSLYDLGEYMQEADQGSQLARCGGIHSSST